MGSGVVVLARTARLTMTVVVKSQITHYSLDPMFLTNNLLQKILVKLPKLRKSCNQVKTLTEYTIRSCPTIAPNNCRLLILKTEDLTKLGNSDGKKSKAQTTAS